MTLDDFKKLNSEQKKKLALIGLGGLIAVYALLNFVVTPMINGSRQASAELDDLLNKLDRAQRSISREVQVREETEATRAQLTEAATQHIPPLDNALSWVAGKVYRSARTVGVDIESVADLGMPSVPWTRFEDISRAFVPYRVRIVAACSYVQLVELMQALEKENPYLSVSEIQVTAQEADVVNHRVRISVDWPVWVDHEQAEKLTAQGEADRG